MEVTGVGITYFEKIKILMIVDKLVWNSKEPSLNLTNDSPEMKDMLKIFQF